MSHIAFVMETHLGHKTYYENLKECIAPSSRIDSTWVPITYKDSTSWLNRLRCLPETIRGPLIGRGQVRAALAHKPLDAVLFNTQVCAVLGGPIPKTLPYVLCTDITPIQYDRMGSYYAHKADRPGLVHQIKHSLNCRVFQQAARLLPWSTWVRDSLIEDYGADPQRIVVLPPGVNTDLWRPGEHPADKIVRILFIGGDFIRKGGERLVEACDLLLEQHLIPNGSIELVLVTRSQTPNRDWIRSYHDLQPNSPELIRLVQQCDVFVLPTQAEAFGIAAIEASAAGLPVIATQVGGLTDIVLNGTTGFLIAPDGKEELAEHLLTLIRQPELRQQMGQAARARAEACFNACENSNRVVNILMQITNGSTITS